MAPIAPNKNERPSCKNMDAMIGATSPQLPKYDVGGDNLRRNKTYPTSGMGGEEAC
jgi:hypothetical protein